MSTLNNDVLLLMNRTVYQIMELKIDNLMFSFIFKWTSAPHQPAPHTTEFIAGASLQRPTVNGKKNTA